MTDFTEHARELTYFLIGLSTIFILAFSLGLHDLWFSTLVVIAVVVATLLIMARFGGGVGPTL